MVHRGSGNHAALLVVLRELLFNAIIHGNRNRQELSVKAAVEDLGGGRFRLEVEDEGPGFDYGLLDPRIPDDPRTLEKRGFPVVKALSTRIEFNDRGNRVAVLLDLPDARTSDAGGLPWKRH